MHNSNKHEQTNKAKQIFRQNPNTNKGIQTTFIQSTRQQREQSDNNIVKIARQ